MPALLTLLCFEVRGWSRSKFLASTTFLVWFSSEHTAPHEELGGLTMTPQCKWRVPRTLMPGRLCSASAGRAAPIPAERPDPGFEGELVEDSALHDSSRALAGFDVALVRFEKPFLYPHGDVRRGI